MILFTMQLKFNNPIKPTKEYPTWITFVDPWFTLPILTYLSFICAKVDVLITRHSSSYAIAPSSPLNEDSFRMMLCGFQFGLLIFFIGNKKLVNFFRTLFFFISALSILYSLSMTGQRILIRTARQGPFNTGRTRTASWNHLSDECLYELSGFFINVITLVVLGVCGWEKQEHGEKKDDGEEAWDFKVYSRYFQWIFRCLLVSVFLSLATTSATVLVKIMSPMITPDKFDVFGYNVITEKFIWMVLLVVVVLSGVSFCFGLPSCCYENKKNDVDDKSSIKNPTP